MSDQFTEVTQQGFGSRIGGSIVGALLGFILVPACLVLLYWNEGRAVAAARALSHGAAAVVEVNASAVDPSADGKLVHLSAQMQPGTAARDPEFGVGGNGLLRLRRTAEMYQWQQDKASSTQQNIGGSQTTQTTYTYKRVWSSSPIESGQFREPAGHENPPMQVRSATFDGQDITLGAYRIDPVLVDKVSSFAPVQAQGTPPADYKAAGDGYYRGADAQSPVVGDVRVTFAGVLAQTVSVVGALAGNTVTAYRDDTGYTIALAEPGVVSATGLFTDAQKAEGRLTWILRGAGFAGVLFGFLFIAGPVTILFAVLPFLKSLADAGAFLVALTFAVPLTLVTIGFAWLAHRPVLGGGLLAAAFAAFVLLRLMHPRRTAAA